MSPATATRHSSSVTSCFTPVYIGILKNTWTTSLVRKNLTQQNRQEKIGDNI